MVVAAGDSLLYDDGFADDASEAMPELEPAPMPMDGDAVAPPEDEPVDGEATPEPAPFAVESLPLTDDQLTAFREHLLAELTPQLESQFSEKERLWDEQRKSLEGKVTAFDSRYLREAAHRASAEDVINQLLQEVGADQTTQDAIKFRIEHGKTQRLAGYAKRLAAEQTQTQQVQAAQTEEQQWFDSQWSFLRSQMHEHATSVGLDPNNEDINADFEATIFPLSHAYLSEMAKPKSQRNPAIVGIDPESPDYIEEMKKPLGQRRATIIGGFQAAKERHKVRVNQMAEATRRRKEAKPSAEAVKRQQARGPQNLSRGAAGSAPMNRKDQIEMLRKQHPDLPYEELHQLAYSTPLAR